MGPSYGSAIGAAIGTITKIKGHLPIPEDGFGRAEARFSSSPAFLVRSINLPSPVSRVGVGRHASKTSSSADLWAQSVTEFGI